MKGFALRSKVERPGGHFTTRYLRCATPGASTARSCSSFRSGPTSAKSRLPPPSMIGAIWSSISSTSPAARYWSMEVGAAAEQDVLLAGCLLRLS